jgi:hypothetical protein
MTPAQARFFKVLERERSNRESERNPQHAAQQPGGDGKLGKVTFNGSRSVCISPIWMRELQ